VVARAILALLLLALLPIDTSGQSLGVSRRASGAATSSGLSASDTTLILGLTDTHAAWGFGGSTPRNTFMLRAVVDTALALGVDFAVNTGDWGGGYVEILHEGHVDSLYNAYINRATWPTYWALGNHESKGSDTLEVCGPFGESIARFPALFQGKGYYYRDVGSHLRIIALNTNVNIDINVSDEDEQDYKKDNPCCGGVDPCLDYHGITDPDSDQRQMLATALATRGGRRLIILVHRPTYGSPDNDPSRPNFDSAADPDGYLTQIEGALHPGERALILSGDQHIPMWLTAPIVGGAVSGATEKGAYHVIAASGSGARDADPTDPPGMLGYLYLNYDEEGAATDFAGLTTEEWADTMTVVGDPGATFAFTWYLLRIVGDLVEIEFFRTFTAQTDGHAQTPGAGHHRRISKHLLTFDANG
jgi:hypothetical protein